MRTFGHKQLAEYEVARDILDWTRATLAAELERARSEAPADAFTIERIQAEMRSVAESIQRLEAGSKAVSSASHAGEVSAEDPNHLV